MSLHSPIIAHQQVESGRELPHPHRRNAPARLSPLEWSVVALAEQDSIESLREPGKLASALGNLFGLSRSNRLRQPRLEALRRVAVHAWRGPWLVPSSELKSFLAAGFTLEQFEVVQASISKGRAAKQSRSFGR